MIRLLIADDQALVRGALSALLGLEPDFEVVAEVSSGADVVPAVLEHGPDVALLDVSLPGVAGSDVCRQLKSLRRSTQVILMSEALERGELARQSAAAGADVAVGRAGADDPLNGLTQQVGVILDELPIIGEHEPAVIDDKP